MQVKHALISVSEHEKLSGPAWLMGCFRLLCLKKPYINKKTHKKTPEPNTVPTKPQSSPFQQFQLSGVFVSASCTHRKAASDRKIYRLCGHTLGPGAALQALLHLLLITNTQGLLRNEELSPLHPYQDTAETATWQS